MKLSELIRSRETFEPQTEEDAFVFGVEVDVDDVTPPAHVREIGLVARTENGDLVNEVLDVSISYILAGMDVLLEFPADVDMGDARHLMATAASVNASLSFLPPPVIDEVSFEAYCQRLERVTEAYLRQQTMTKYVMPVTNYLQYLYAEVLDPEAARTFVPEDGYVLSRFHASMTVDQSDALKARVRDVVEAHFGGADAFREFTLGLMASVAREVEGNLSELAAEKAGEAPPAGWYWLLRKADQKFVLAFFDGAGSWVVEDVVTDEFGPHRLTHVVATENAGAAYVLIEAVTPPAPAQDAAEEEA